MIPSSKWSLVKSLVLAFLPCALMVFSMNIAYGAYHSWEEPFFLFGGTIVPTRIEIGIWLFAYGAGLIIVRLIAVFRREWRSDRQNNTGLYI